MKNKNKNKQNTNTSDTRSKYILWPGETFDFNENLLHYDAFGYSNGQLTSKRCGMIMVNPSTNQIADSESEEVYRSVGRYYSPKVDDFVIGTITYKSSEFYKVDIGSYTHAILNSKDFEGATKKIKPNLNIGDVIFARVDKLNKYDSPALSCISETENKNWASGESYFGVLKDGMVYNFPKVHTWDYISNNYALERLRDYISYEICIGYNGKVYINSDLLENMSKIYEVLLKSTKLTEDEAEKLLNNMFKDKMQIS
jgi:exosome complex component RRP40